MGLRLVSMALVAALLGVTFCVAVQGQEGSKEAVIQKCVNDLAVQLKVGAAEVKVVLAEEVTWPDGSLGHPEPGKDYIMMLIPGHRVLLAVGEKLYEYHTDRAGNRLVFCGEVKKDAGGVQEPPATPVQPMPGGLVGSAAGTVVLYLQDIPDEANLNNKLMARSASDPNAPPETVLDLCSDFTVSNSGIVLAKRRTSRSTHELVLAQRGTGPKPLMTALDFTGLTWLGTSPAYVFLAAPMVGTAYQLYGGAGEGKPEALDWAPPIKRARNVAVSQRQNILVVTAAAGNEGDAVDVTVLDLAARKVIATFRATKAVAGVLAAPTIHTAAPQ